MSAKFINPFNSLRSLAYKCIQAVYQPFIKKKITNPSSTNSAC